MKIDPSTETLVLLHDASPFIPGQPHRSTLHRWRTKGVRGTRLPTLLIGGRRYVSREALAWFFDHATAAADGMVADVETPRQRKRRHDAAEDQLRAAGVLKKPK